MISLYTFFNNNTPHGEQRWTVLIRQLLHTFQWQHATQWATLNCFNQTVVHCAKSCKQSITPQTTIFCVMVRKSDNSKYCVHYSQCTIFRYDYIHQLSQLIITGSVSTRDTWWICAVKQQTYFNCLWSSNSWLAWHYPSKHKTFA